MDPARSRRPKRALSYTGTLGDEFARHIGALTAVSSGLERPDLRTEDQYAEEVDTYLAGLQSDLEARYLHDLARHQPASLQLVVDNPTEHNFERVRLVIHVEGDVDPWPESMLGERDKPPMPRARPRPLGTPERIDPFLPDLSALGLGRSPSFGYGPTLPGSRGYTAESTGSATITFGQFHLHPLTPKALPVVPLMVRAPAGSRLRITWDAVAANAVGKLHGETEVVVAATSMRVEIPELPETGS